MRDWPEGGLTRDEVSALLNEHTRWQVSYCWGAHQADEAGTGRVLPPGILDRVPTAAAKRRIRRGTSTKSYFYARLDLDAGTPILRIEEG